MPDVTFSLTDSQYDFAETCGITYGQIYKMYYFFWSVVEKEFREYGGDGSYNDAMIGDVAVYPNGISDFIKG